ncbi:MAG: ABC transporter ATP-binding protein [Candidatus Brocadiia bacterium]
MGVAPQQLALYEEMSGEANLRFFGHLYGLSGRHLARRVAEALELVGLTERAGDRAATYSGGMKRRLNLAAALVHEPELLLLDEPTVGVDPQSRNAILERIRDLTQTGKTIVYCTHYMEEAQRLCDRVAILDSGRLLALDTVENLIAEHGGTSVVHAVFADREVRVDTNEPLTEIRRLDAEGELVRFSVERPDLESVFLALTGRHLRD